MPVLANRGELSGVWDAMLGELEEDELGDAGGGEGREVEGNRHGCWWQESGGVQCGAQKSEVVEVISVEAGHATVVVARVHG